jgi:outer membrane protein assembly factor BamB
MKIALLACLVPSLALGVPSSIPQDTATSKPAKNSGTDQAELEAAFAKLMTGCQMVGLFTDTDKPDKPPQKDSYTIAKVTKLAGDRWRFDAKVEYGTKSVTVPVIVNVKWAGDTPMIQVTKLSIPMLGTYSARVVIYDGQYAGLWSGSDHGGHMFGKIVRPQAEPAQATAQQGKAGEWSTWRGPDGSAIARTGNPPTEWSEEKNIRWKIRIPGDASSSPIVFGDRIYVTTAVEIKAEGKAEAPPRRRRGGFGFRRPAPTTVHEFAVIAVNRKDGKIVWKKTVKKSVPHEAGHATSSQASGSPLTDGQHIYAFFGSRGLYCLDMEGNVKWSKDFGTMRTAMGFGEGASPALYGDTLIVNWDHEGDSFLATFRKGDGKELWRKPRNERTSWSTPIIAPVDGRPQVIISATRASRGYDLETGEVIWSCSGMTGNCIPTPIHVDGIAYLMSGFMGSALQAIKLSGAKGDITDSEDHVIWDHRRGCPYTPSGLVYDGYVYFLFSNSGRLSCLDAKTGKAYYSGKRLRGIREVYSSPVGAAGHVYVTGRKGRTKVIKLGKQFEEVASNRLNDTIDGSPAIVGDEIYMRGRKYLYCIAEDKTGGR